MINLECGHANKFECLAAPSQKCEKEILNTIARVNEHAEKYQKHNMFDCLAGACVK